MEPSFDTWTSLFLIVAGFGFFLASVLLFNPENRKNNVMIAGIVLAFSSILVIYVLYWTRYLQYFPDLMTLTATGYYAIGPLLYLYFSRLYHVDQKKQFGLHFLPAVIAFFIFLFPFLGKLVQLAPAQIFSCAKILHLLIIPWLMVAHLFIYGLLCWRIIGQHQENTTGMYETIRKKWALFLLRLYGLFVLAYVSYFILSNFAFFNSTWDYAISMTMSLAIYGIGYMVFQMPAIFNGELFQQLFLPSTIEEPSLADGTLEVLYQRLLEHLEREKPYLDSEIRLVQLADQLDYSVHLLSQIINQKAGKNFNQMINEYRLRDAVDLLVTAPHLSIKSIYYEVGFNNKATFYQTFKKQYNCTPSEFRNHQLRSKRV